MVDEPDAFPSSLGSSFCSQTYRQTPPGLCRDDVEAFYTAGTMRGSQLHMEEPNPKASRL